MLIPEMSEEMCITFSVFVRIYNVTIHCYITFEAHEMPDIFLNPMSYPSVPLGASFDM